MKKFIKILLLFFISIFLISCSAKKESLGVGYDDSKHKGRIKTAPVIERMDEAVVEKKDFILVDVLYGTNRNKNVKVDLNNFYGVELGELRYGMCQVSIPKTHKLGEVERPSWLRLEFKEDSKKHIVIKSLEEFDKSNFFSLMRSKLSKSSQYDILIFIHGYNVSFAKAIRRTAQISYDLNFPGVAMTYSWPSQGSLGINSYKKDEEYAKKSVLFLTSFLEDVVKNAKSHQIHIIAHSMGNRVLTNAIANVKEKNKKLFNEVILAAPDINSKVFIKEILPKIKTKMQRLTLYTSSDDEALKISRVIHKEYRLGESGKYLTVAKGMDTIDSTGIDTSLLGHSYYGNTKEMLNDIRKLLVKDLAPTKRGLIQKVKSGFSYWKIRLNTKDR